jgi:HEAT repeat protein
LKRLLDELTEPYLRLCAAGAISKIDPEDADAVAVLVQGLSDASMSHRTIACEFLGDGRNNRAVLNVMPLLGDPAYSVRFAAAEAIGRVFDDWLCAVGVCIAMLGDDDEIVRQAGAECLLGIGRPARAHLNLLKMAMLNAPWQARLDMEEALDALRRI